MKAHLFVRGLAVLGGIALVVLLALGLYAWRLSLRGFGARDTPSALEAKLASAMREGSIPGSAKRLQNPLPDTPEVLAQGRAHWADHCAVCHANDGSGQTQLGQNLYPRAPDMRKPATQEASDGELFYTIENGIRLSGMPAWHEAGEESESWALVRFIRHLPKLSPQELRQMKALNPKTPAELREEQEEEQFLQGGPVPSAPEPHPH